MRCFLFFAALAVVLGSTQTMACQNAGCTLGDQLAPAECKSIGCVRSPTNAFEKLVKTAERTLSLMRVTERGNAPGLCATGNCLTEPAPTQLPENCGRAGCATPEPKASPAAAPANDAANIQASTLVTDAFAVMAKRPIRLPPAVAWAEWAGRGGFGGLYKPSTD
jgi:hypothetical protein